MTAFDLAAELGRLLQARGLRVVTAESCTGGLLAATITSVAGSSHWFERGFVTYANAAKQAVLDVRAATLDAEGAVSEAVVAEMTAGALAHSDSDVAVAISGVAGPGGGTALKPVGMVCCAWQFKGGSPHTETKYLQGDRNAVREQAVDWAISGLIRRCERAARE